MHFSQHEHKGVNRERALRKLYVRMSQGDPELGVSLGYKVSSRPAWAL